MKKMIDKKKVKLIPLTKGHISLGWLKWLNDKTNYKNLSTIKKRTTRKDLINFLKSSKKKGNKLFAIYDNLTNSYIGNASLTELDYINKHCKYGRFIGNKNFLKKGYGQIILYHLFSIAFNEEKMNKCYTQVFIDNQISIKSNIKFGMKKEGILRENVLKDKYFKNVILFSMLKSEFKSKYES